RRRRRGVRRRRHLRLRALRRGRRRPGPAGVGRIGRMTEQSSAEQSNAARIRELNTTIRYTMWSVFQATEPLPARSDELAREAAELFDQLGAKDVVVRGTYDVSGLRADADLMIWWHAPSADGLQDAYARLRRTGLGRCVTPVWSQLALHRQAEFN